MTAEVGVLNRSAVALAADSAVSSQGNIYESANKLFTLSKYDPVGIMVYGHASFMGMPWNTLIKSFREDLGNKSFDELESYSSKFFEWINKNENSIVLEPEQSTPKINSYYRNVSQIIEILNSNAQYKASKVKDKTSINLDKIVEDAINELETEAQEMPYASDAGSQGKMKEEDIRREIPNTKEIVKQAYKREPLPYSIVGVVDDSVIDFDKIEYISTKYSTTPESLGCGVVVSGFGSEEYIPHIFEYRLGTMHNGKLPMEEVQRYDEGGSAIIPFAQKDMTDRFVRGIDRDYKMEIFSYVENLLDEYPRAIIDSLKNNDNINVSDSYLNSLLGGLMQMKSDMINDFGDDINNMEENKYVDPIVNNIENLPKDELGVMAETFVNITSFKRRVSRDEEETVGGPIDVAIISKGDGFIWVKRKHYFDPDLNHRFFENYYDD